MILVLAGTKDSREIIKILKEEGYSVLASVVTNYGAELLTDLEIEVIKGKLTDQKIKNLAATYKLETIIDATHPFAKQISKAAMQVSNDEEINYIRFEREKVEVSNHDLVTKVEGYQQAAQKAKEFDKILLTIGSKNLNYFTAQVEDWSARLIARVLPKAKFIKQAEELGFNPKNLIGMQGPFSKKINKILLKEYNIDVLVTKASGKTGGLDTKLEAAWELGVAVILITRPQLAYKNIVHNWRELKEELAS